MLLAVVVIPWVVIGLTIETIQEWKQNRTTKKKRKQSKPFENIKAFMKLMGALLVFAGVALLCAVESVPYLKDVPHVIQRNYQSEANVIEYVDDVGKRIGNEVNIDGKTYLSSKIKSKHEGRYIVFEYLPNTKIIVSYK